MLLSENKDEKTGATNARFSRIEWRALRRKKSLEWMKVRSSFH